MIAKQIMFWLGLVFLILGLIWGATLLQIIPIILIVILLGSAVWTNIKVIIPVMVLSILMLVANLLVISMIDILFWTAVILVFIFDKERL